MITYSTATLKYLLKAFSESYYNNKGRLNLKWDVQKACTGVMFRSPHNFGQMAKTFPSAANKQIQNEEVEQNQSRQKE